MRNKKLVNPRFNGGSPIFLAQFADNVSVILSGFTGLQIWKII